MNKETAKRKSILYTAVPALVIACLLLCVLIRQPEQQIVFDGHYPFDGEDAYTYDVGLNGDWEFYPDVLLYSDPPETMPEKQMVQVPDRWLCNTEHAVPVSGNASYRLVIDDFRAFAGYSNIVLSMAGFPQDYRIYINGIQTNVRIPSPTGYPIYAVNDGGEKEIVIEVLNSTSGLTLTPHIWAIGVNIGKIDSARNAFLILVSLFLILFVMFLVFSVSQSSHKLRPMAILGILMTVLSVMNLFWVSGYQDSLNRIFSNGVWNLLCMAVRLAVIGWGLHTFLYKFPDSSFRRFRIWSIVLLAAAFAGNLLVYFLHQPAGMIAVWLLTGLPVVIWICTVFYSIRVQRLDCLEDASLLTAVFGTMAALCINDWYPDRRVLLLALPLVILYLIIICFVQYYRYQQAALARTRELLEIERFANRTQTAMLSSQIQPHFLYNTLLTIQELCRFDPAEASRVIVRFSEYLRHNIDFMNYAELIPFEKEEKHIDNFIYIQEARFQEKLSYTADIRTRDFMIPPLTVQPLLENAIKYGVRSRIDGGFVSLSVYEDRAGIHILVRNSGDGFDPDNVRENHSLGNIRTRLKTLLNAILTISSREGSEGTTVEIFIPSGNIVRCSEEKGVQDETGIS